MPYSTHTVFSAAKPDTCTTYPEPNRDRQRVVTAAKQSSRWRRLSGEEASSSCRLNLPLGELAEDLGAHNDGHRGELSLAQHLEVTLYQPTREKSKIDRGRVEEKISPV